MKNGVAEGLDDNFLILSFEYTNLFEEEFEHKYENIVIKTNDYIIKDTLSGYFTAHFDPTENGNFLDLDVKFNLVSSGNTTISKDAKIKDMLVIIKCRRRKNSPFPVFFCPFFEKNKKN